MKLRRDWRDDAACRGRATASFDPWDPPGTAYNVPRDAQKFCDRCPVRVECLADAFHHDDQGVRGGTTMRQRKAIRRPRLRVACPVCQARLTEPTLTDRQLIQLCPGCGLSWRTRRPSTRQTRPAPAGSETTEELRRDVTHSQALPQSRQAAPGRVLRVAARVRHAGPSPNRPRYQGLERRADVRAPVSPRRLVRATHP